MRQLILRVLGVVAIVGLTAPGCVFDKSGLGPWFGIDATSPPDACKGAPYGYTFRASGGKEPYTWSIQGQTPPGLRLDTSTGTLTGTPRTNGKYVFTLEVRDSSSPQDNYLRDFDIDVADFNITTPGTSLNVRTLYFCPGAGVEIQLDTCGGTEPVKWKLDSAPSTLPTGLSVTSDGRIVGTTSATGTFLFTVAAEDGSTPPRTAKKELRLESSNGLTILGDNVLPTGKTSVAYGPVALAACGGSGSYTWSNPDGVLAKKGLGLTTQANKGIVQGTPTTGGVAQFVGRVVDNLSTSTPKTARSVEYAFYVAPGPLSITSTSPLPDATECAPYNYAFQAMGGTGNYTWKVAGGSQLPTGLALSTAGVLSQAPVLPAVNPASFSVEVSEGSDTATGAFTLRVAEKQVTPVLVIPEVRHTLASAAGFDRISLSKTGSKVKLDFRFGAGGPPLTNQMLNARLEVLGSCANIGSTDFAGPQDVNGDSQLEMVARFPGAMVMPLLQSAGLQAGDKAVLRLAIDVQVDTQVQTFVNKIEVSLDP